MPGSTDKSGFHLTNANQGFSSRSNDIFAGLDLLATQHVSDAQTSTPDNSGIVKEDPTDEPISGSDKRRFNECPTRYYRPREPKQVSSRQDDGEFQPPRRRPPRSRRLPDYKRNPGRWTSYDLSDVSNNQLTDRSNAAAAFEFLRERQKLRDSLASSSGSDMESEINVDDKSPKHIFTKKAEEGMKSSIEEKAEDDTPKFAAGKRVMPEYVVGANKPKGTQKPRSSTNSKMIDHDTVQLSHLDEENLADTKSTGDKKDTGMKNVAKTAKGDSQKDGDQPDCSPRDSGSSGDSKSMFKSRKGKKRTSTRRRQDDDEGSGNE